MFSLIISALLFSNSLTLKHQSPLDSEQLLELKTKLSRNPDDSQTKKHLRKLDLELRKKYFRRIDFAKKGGYLLAGCVAALLVTIKTALLSRKKLPNPKMETGEIGGWSQAVTRACLSVVAIGIIFGGSGLLLARWQEGRFPKNLERHTKKTTSHPPEVVIDKPSFPTEKDIRQNWPRFRGPGGGGISAYTNIPSQWDGKENKGILWKTTVSLPGNNSPVVWKDRVFLSGADEKRREVYCFDANSGEILWQRAVEDLPGRSPEMPKVDEETGFAAPSCTVDDKRVCALFANGDLVCFDFSGEQLWIRGLGIPQNSYGHASSLLIHQGILLVLFDQKNDGGKQSKILAFDVRSGDIVWQKPRPVSDSWASPIVIDVGETQQLVTCGNPWVIAYNPIDGSEVWRAECLSGDVAPSPIFAGGRVFVVRPSTKLIAISPDGKGDVTESKILWTAEDGIPDIPSPVSDGQLIFLLTSGGLLTCYDVNDGNKIWEKELETMFNSSPTLVGDRIYLLSDYGVMFIIHAGREFKELNRAKLGEECYASPAFLTGRIYIRSKKHLFAIGGD